MTDKDQKTSKVYAVIVTYNRKELLCRCIDAILAQTVPVARIVVIDNNSSDGTKEMLKERGFLAETDPALQYVPSETSQTGPSGAPHSEPSGAPQTEPSEASQTEPSGVSQTEPSEASQSVPSGAAHPASSEASVKEPLIDYHRLSRNEGGAGGFHHGLKRVRDLVKKETGGSDSDTAGSYAWIMDDDVIPERDCLEELLRARDRIDGKVSFIASAVRGPEGEALNVPKLDKQQFMKYTDWYRYLEYGIVRVVKATFVSLLIDTDAIMTSGLPWKEFFIWGDDSEYTQRLIRDYGDAYMAGRSKVLHLRSSKDELSIVKEQNVARIPLYFYYYRNNLIVFHEYESFLYRFLCMGKLFYDAVRVLVAGKYKLKKLGVLTKAFFNYVFGSYDRKSFRDRRLK